MTDRLDRWAPWLTGLIAVLAGAFYLIAGRDGSIHGYYSPAAYAMSQSFHNFLYGAVDSGGWAGLDKIPGSLWPQAASVAVFGYNSWAILVPVVLATVGAIVLLYLAVARWIGRPAGVVAALAYAVTPAVAVTAQVNVPEAWLGLAFAATAYLTVRALQSGSAWWLVGTGLAIAAAFQVKMLQGWTIWPAVIVAYLLCAPVRLWTRAWHLLVAGVVSLVASLWWVMLVTLTPAADRPYVGGSDTNSAWEMVFGYNGLGRFGLWSGRSFVVDMGGTAGIERIIGPQVAVDLGWLIPLAVMALIAGVAVTWGRPRIDPERAGWVFFGAFLVFVSAPIIVSEGIHTFYILAYAPAIAALVGGAAVLGWRGLAHPTARWIVMAAFVVEIAWTAWLVQRSPAYHWAMWVAVGLAVVSLVLMALSLRALALALALAAVLIAPLTWTLNTLGPTNDINPTANTFDSGGPGGRGGPGGPGSGPPPGMRPGGPAPASGGPGPGQGGPTGAGQSGELATWLISHNPGTRYLVAAGSNSASGLTVSGVPGVLTMGGGFQGADPTPTAAELAELIASGQLAYVLSPSQGGMSDGPPPGAGPGPNNSGSGAAVTAERNAWIAAHCAPVPQAPTGVLACTP